jgi:four helix bundle protein
MNRASDAVSLLIAEGSGLQTDALFSHRLGLAVGETFEVISGSFLALDRKYIAEAQQAQIYEWGMPWLAKYMRSVIHCANSISHIAYRGLRYAISNTR